MSALARPDDYTKLCEGVRRLAGVDLLQYKRGQMERRIRTFAEKQGVKDLGEYLRVLERDRDQVTAFLDRVTINVSQLWRNPEQWELVGRTLLPELAEQGPVRVWSAGCSYGAEAYTVAALACAKVPKARVSIRGTDIDRRMVERARAGVFSKDDARDAPKAELQRWFDPEGDGWAAKAELKRLVSFEVGDLLRQRPKPAAYDLVLCRNTVIYFNEEIRDALHERLAASLRPGGYLLIGSTERVAKPREMGLVPDRPFLYRKA
jgi:chemotaxis protein methyltransferase CheR